ncbi:MAG: sulfatase-like hydrolase/transferase [Acidobacteriota bacterium]
MILDREKSGLGVGFDTYEELLVPDPVSQQIYLATPARIALSLLKRHPPERRARATIERACAYLAARPASAAPLFLWVHLYDPHVPYRPPSMFRDQADPAYRGAFEVNKETVVALREGKLSLSERDLEHGRRMYQAEVAYADSCLGQLVLAVKKMPGSWITVATADHGESLGEHKYTFFHGENLHGPSMHVPLMIAGPGIPKGLHVPWLVRLVDVMPTLLDLAAVPVPDGLDGQSLAPALAGKGTPALASYGEDGDQLYFVVSPGNRLEHKDVGLRTESHSYVLRPSSGAEELYDLRSDPGETRNVAAEPDQAEAKARLKDELAKITDLGSYGGAPPLDDDEARKALEQLGYVSPGAPRTSPPATPKGH